MTVVASVADLEASLKIDAQCATWIDTQRQSWTEDVRDMGARVPFPLTPAQAVHRAARFLDRLVASALPEAMKPAREGGWSPREFELWSDRLRRVTLVCENEMYFGNERGGRREEQTETTSRRSLERSLDGHPRIGDGAPSRRASLAALGVSPPRPREAIGSAVRRRADDAARDITNALHAGGHLTNAHRAAFTSAERLAALRRDENYQALVNLYRDRMRNGTMPRGLYSGPNSGPAREEARRLEQAREDPERDALIAATVSNMMRRGQVVSREDLRAVATHRLGQGTVENRPRVFPTRPETREETSRGRDVASVSSLSPPAPESEDEGFDVTRSSINPTDPESEDDVAAGDEPRRAARVLRTLEDAEHFFATLPPGAEGRLLVPGAATSGDYERPGIAATAGSDAAAIRPADDLDVSSDPQDDVPPQLRRRVLEDGVARPSAGPSGPECPPRERVDVDDDDYVSAEGVPVTCPATLRGMLAEARRAAEEADAAAEEAKDAVTCQICYANRRDALVMPCCHLLYCYRCVTRASEVAEARGHPDRCPCCRGPISGVLRCKLTE